MTATFSFPTRILFGEGSRAALSEELARLGVHRPLLVTDPELAESGLTGQIVASLSDCQLYTGAPQDPAEADVLGGLDRYRAGSCDGLVALGGGSAIDTAKAIRLLTTHPGPLADYDVTTGGPDRITADLPPLAALPTTAGTGSEVTRTALIRLPQTGRKTCALSPHLIPSVAICDPELTYTLPAPLTAGTGMDAFTHCIESYLSTTYHPICDGIALEGLRYVARGVEVAARDGTDRKSRRELMMGSLLGGISQHKGLGVIHSLSHALGVDGRPHHGTLNAILLPHALRFNLPAAEAAMSELASQLGVGRGIHGPRHLITLAELVLVRLPLPQRLGAVPDLDRARIPEYARLALLDPCHRTNPRPCTQADLEALLEAAW